MNILLFLMSALAGYETPAALPHPPFVRAWTLALRDPVSVFAVRDDVVYCSSGSGAWALAARTGEVRWRALAGAKVIDAELTGRDLYAATADRHGATLHVVNATTGQVRSLARLSRPPLRITADDTDVFVLDRSGRVSAFGRHSGALRWSRQIESSGRRELPSGQIVVAGRALYVAAGAGDYGVDVADGRVLWFRPSEFASLRAPIVVDADVITSHDELRRTNVRSGRVVWSAPLTGTIGVAGGVIIGSDDEGPMGRNVTDGRLRWRKPPTRSASVMLIGADPPLPSDDEGVWLREDPIAHLTKDGREIWSRSNVVTGIPFHAANGVVITVDGSRVLGYREGSLPPLPAANDDRQQLATRLVSQFEHLDDAERMQLKDLSPYAFPPLLQRYMKWARAHERERSDDDRYDLHHLLTEAAPLLLATAGRDDTRSILQARQELAADSEWRKGLDALAQKRGDPELYVPVFVEELRRLPRRHRTESPMLSAVARSSQPQGVALMLEALRDANSPAAWRREAFRHLALAGGVDGVNTVRQHRPGRAPIRPWFERLDVSRLPRSQVLSVLRDKTGRTWMLFESDVLGNESDLFIVARSENGGWGRPVFTDVWTRPTFREQPPMAFKGIPLDRLKARDWIEIFPADPSVYTDSDGDDLTDRVEARLGADPTRPDTDGDGLPDAVDPCPNAAPRALSDIDKIVAASLEARFFESKWRVPAKLAVRGIEPFELYGYAGQLVWKTTSAPHPLDRIYGGGVNSIGFQRPDPPGDDDCCDEQSDDELLDGADQPFVELSDDGLTARTVITKYSGGLDGDGFEVRLRKVGDEWFVVDLELVFLS
jgi:outer membrane protein assembly factor BamB